MLSQTGSESAQNAVFPAFGVLDPNSYLASYVGEAGKVVKG